MPTSSYEIRKCNSCGLRYPLVDGHPFGTRCPACMGDTEAVLKQELIMERSASADEKDGRSKSIAVLFDNVRSAWNVGSILRSADGFGFCHAFLCGITPSADNESVTKTSLGAEESVPWSYHKDAVKLVKGLKAEGWKIYGLEEAACAMEISHAERVTAGAQREVLVVGNEITGVDPELLELCDEIFFIPMRGQKKSYNVAIAFGIAAYVLSGRMWGR